MGKVVAKIRILPKQVDQFEKLKKSVEGLAAVMEEQPLAFGMNALLIVVRMEDEGGAMEQIEKQLEGNPLISSFEVLEVGRI